MTVSTLKQRILRIASVSSVMGISNVVAMASLIVKNKALAILVGPAGIGIISQAVQLQQVVANGGSLGLASGLQQALSRIQNPDDPDFRRIANLGFRLLIAMFFVTALVVLIFQRSISQAVFDGDHPGWMAAIAVWLALAPVSMVIDAIFVSAQLRFCESTIQEGTILILDDFFSYKGHQQKGVHGAFVAWTNRFKDFQFRPVSDYGMGGVVYMAHL